MADIEELEQRVRAALDRISAGLDGMGDAGGNAALEAALEDEKTANAQLEERVRALKEQNEAQLAEVTAANADRIAALESEVASLRETAQDAQAQNRGLRQSNQRMQAALQSLREAGSAGVDPHMLNQAMMSELEGVRAARAADRAEVDEILGALKPMLEEGADA